MGYDDYRDLKLEGAHSALPIWTDFMKRAHTHRAYRTVNEFDVPDGVVSVQIDPQTGELATGSCPDVRNAYYLVGTQPTQFCHLHGGGRPKLPAGILLPSPRILRHQGSVYTPPLGQALPPPRPNAGSPEAQQQAQEQPPQPQDQQQQKKKGFFDKLKGIFK